MGVRCHPLPRQKKSNDYTKEDCDKKDHRHFEVLAAES